VDLECAGQLPSGEIKGKQKYEKKERESTPAVEGNQGRAGTAAQARDFITRKSSLESDVRRDSQDSIDVEWSARGWLGYIHKGGPKVNV
jgi:hypothetical protein